MKKNNAKRTVVVIALIALMAIPSMMAYFTDTAEKINTFTIGSVDITLTETEWDAEGEDDAKNVVAGDEIAKNPVVKNVGNSEAYVFVKVDGVTNEGADKMFEIDWNTTNWTKYDAACTTDSVVYYYGTDGKLAADKEAEALFNTVTFANDQSKFANAANQEGKFPITVKAFAIQAEGITDYAAAWTEVQGASNVIGE